MGKELRKTGIEVIGECPWGTHLCHFYHTKEDLIDTLVPYFKAGLQNNEFCMWVTSEPLGVENAMMALRQDLEDLEDYLEKGQIEILDYTDWYTKSGKFNADEVLRGWVEKEHQAVQRGFEGLRLTGNTFWLESSDWNDFSAYEATVDGVIGQYRMLAICSYSCDKCGASELVEVATNHEFCLIRQHGQWEVFQSERLKQAERSLERSERDLRIRSEINNVFLTYPDEEMYIRVLKLIMKTMESKYGTFGYLDEEGSFVAFAVTREIYWDKCNVPDKDIIFHKGTFGDIWGRAVKQRKTLIDNDGPFNTPKGHIHIENMMVTPIIFKDEVISAIHIANKASGYDKKDEALLEAIAHHIAPVLYARLERDKKEVERNRAEEALRRERDFAESLIETAQAIVMVLDTVGRIVTFNPYMEEVSGYKLEEVKGKDWFTTFLPEYDHARIRELFSRAVNDMQTRGNINPIVIKDGQQRYIEWYDKTLKDAAGNVIGLLAIGQDITERKLAENKVKELLTSVKSERDKLSALVNSITDEVWFTDQERRFTLANPTALREFNLTIGNQVRVEDLAQGLEVLRSDGSPRPLEEAPPLRALKGEVVQGQEEIVRIPIHGKLRYRQVNSAPVRDAAGQIIGAVSIVRDITERKQAENKLKYYAERLEDMVAERTQELREAQAQLVRREKLAALGQIAGGVAHELRNPLGAIKNTAYFLNMILSQPDTETKEALGILNKEIAACERIISGLLGFARPGPPHRTKVDINDIVRTALSRNPVPDNIEVESQFDERLPTIQADPEQLDRVFENLVINALQAMPEGGRLVVKTEAPTPDRVTVSVTDTGVGIDEQTKGKVFEPLFTTKAKGIGLGLALANMVVQAHSGTFDVESEVGKGTTFTVSLPVDGEK